jgi:hypothetical protein
VLDLVAVAAAKADIDSKILYCPANKSNALIDFLYKDEDQHFHAFQVTLRHRHNAKVADIKQLENAVGDASKLSIYYAVPSEHFRSFVRDPVDPKGTGALCDIFHVVIPNPNDFPDKIDLPEATNFAILFEAYTLSLMTKKNGFFFDDKKRMVFSLPCKFC